MLRDDDSSEDHTPDSKSFRTPSALAKEFADILRRHNLSSLPLNDIITLYKQEFGVPVRSKKDYGVTSMNHLLHLLPSHLIRVIPRTGTSTTLIALTSSLPDETEITTPSSASTPLTSSSYSTIDHLASNILDLYSASGVNSMTLPDLRKAYELHFGHPIKPKAFGFDSWSNLIHGLSRLLDICQEPCKEGTPILSIMRPTWGSSSSSHATLYIPSIETKLFQLAEKIQKLLRSMEISAIASQNLSKEFKRYYNGETIASSDFQLGSLHALLKKLCPPLKLFLKDKEPWISDPSSLLPSANFYYEFAPRVEALLAAADEEFISLVDIQGMYERTYGKKIMSRKDYNIPSNTELFILLRPPIKVSRDEFGTCFLSMPHSLELPPLPMLDHEADVDGLADDTESAAAMLLEGFDFFPPLSISHLDKQSWETVYWKLREMLVKEEGDVLSIIDVATEDIVILNSEYETPQILPVIPRNGLRFRRLCLHIKLPAHRQLIKDIHDVFVSEFTSSRVYHWHYYSSDYELVGRPYSDSNASEWIHGSHDLVTLAALDYWDYLPAPIGSAVDPETESEKQMCRYKRAYQILSCVLMHHDFELKPFVLHSSIDTSNAETVERSWEAYGLALFLENLLSVYMHPERSVAHTAGCDTLFQLLLCAVWKSFRYVTSTLTMIVGVVENYGKRPRQEFLSKAARNTLLDIPSEFRGVNNQLYKTLAAYRYGLQKLPAHALHEGVQQCWSCETIPFPGTDLLRCTGCKVAAYCDLRCEQFHSLVHQLSCKVIATGLSDTTSRDAPPILSFSSPKSERELVGLEGLLSSSPMSRMSVGEVKSSLAASSSSPATYSLASESDSASTVEASIIDLAMEFRTIILSINSNRNAGVKLQAVIDQYKKKHGQNVSKRKYGDTNMVNIVHKMKPYILALEVEADNKRTTTFQKTIVFAPPLDDEGDDRGVGEPVQITPIKETSLMPRRSVAELVEDVLTIMSVNSVDRLSFTDLLDAYKAYFARPIVAREYSKIPNVTVLINQLNGDKLRVTTVDGEVNVERIITDVEISIAATAATVEDASEWKVVPTQSRSKKARLDALMEHVKEIMMEEGKPWIEIKHLVAQYKTKHGVAIKAQDYKEETLAALLRKLEPHFQSSTKRDGSHMLSIPKTSSYYFPPPAIEESISDLADGIETMMIELEVEEMTFRDLLQRYNATSETPISFGRYDVTTPKELVEKLAPRFLLKNGWTGTAKSIVVLNSTSRPASAEGTVPSKLSINALYDRLGCIMRERSVNVMRVADLSRFYEERFGVSLAKESEVLSFRDLSALLGALNFVLFGNAEDKAQSVKIPKTSLYYTVGSTSSMDVDAGSNSTTAHSLETRPAWPAREVEAKAVSPASSSPPSAVIPDAKLITLISQIRLIMSKEKVDCMILGNLQRLYSKVFASKIDVKSFDCDTLTELMKRLHPHVLVEYDNTKNIWVKLPTSNTDTHDESPISVLGTSSKTLDLLFSRISDILIRQPTKSMLQALLLEAYRALYIDVEVPGAYGPMHLKDVLVELEAHGICSNVSSSGEIRYFLRPRAAPAADTPSRKPKVVAKDTTDHPMPSSESYSSSPEAKKLVPDIVKDPIIEAPRHDELLNSAEADDDAMTDYFMDILMGASVPAPPPPQLLGAEESKGADGDVAISGAPTISRRLSSGSGLDCIVCWDAVADHAFIPCGHKVVCQACGETVFRTTKICTQCRNTCYGVFKIFAA